MAEAADRYSSELTALSQLPIELTAALQYFDRTAQYVRQYLTLDSTYRRRQALDRARSELETLEQSLETADTWFALDLARLASSWRGLLEVQYQALEARGETA